MATIRKAFILFLLVFISLALPSRFKLITYGFKLEKLQLHLPSSPVWDIEPTLSHQELQEIFSAPFSFLGKGAQSYVFQSKDQQYVLKLFRFDPRERSFSDKENWDAWKEEKAISLFTSCKLSWDRARDETALLHLHLNPTSSTLPILTIKAPLGRTLHLDLDRYRFALQKKSISNRGNLRKGAFRWNSFQKSGIDLFITPKNGQKRKSPTAIQVSGAILVF